MATTTYTLTVTAEVEPAVLDAAVREALFGLADELAPPVVTTATAEPPPASAPVSIALSDPYGVRETFNIIAGGGGYTATPTRPAAVTIAKP